ncbi:MAG: type IV secretion system protein [Fulvimarina manganoxydans]|uniref:type IV secretion system protein n=1 Tax=Fulvimarina manganoxydans TaxID=937218 RepID=UPI0023525AC0|nr:type IV secretion system protein [Fulvimarina manganoxydans]MCK5934369.1 type IV secretion system protein [Fulvimarina manganoxydans]
MSVVTYFVETTDGYLADAAKTQFGALAATVGTLGSLACTIVLIFVAINLVFQWRSLDGRQTFWLCVKMVLIAIFAQSWTQFDAFSSALLNGIDTVAGSLVASVGGGEPGPSGTFAEEFDELLETLTETLDATSQEANWFAGAMLDIVGVLLVSLLGGIAAFILIFSRLVVTLMISLAPIMIFLTLFEVTKDYFLRWLSGTISFALYPVIVAGMFATIIGVGNSLIASLGDPENASTIGQVLPLFMLILMAKGFILSTPFIVRSISGNVVMPAMVPMGDNAAKFMAGVLKTKGSQSRERLGARNVSELAGAYTRGAVVGTGTQIQRMVERSRRIAAAGK